MEMIAIHMTKSLFHSIWESYLNKTTKIIQKIHFWCKLDPKVKQRIQKSSGKTRKEIKPMVIDDVPTIINLDTKTRT